MRSKAGCTVHRWAQDARQRDGFYNRLPNGKWRAAITIGFTEDTHNPRRRVKGGFKTKKEALECLAELKNKPKKDSRITFRALYEKWFPTHRAGKSTMDCYKAAMAYFKPVWGMTIQDIDVDDLQECLDACPHGKRTRENMKAMCGLLYKYGIPRNHIPENLNLAPFLAVSGEKGEAKKSFDDAEIELIRAACGRVPYAEYVYCMIYTGFRPSEALALNVANYDRARRCIVGGAKTEAGTDRTVTIPPKIQPIVDLLAGDRAEGPLFINHETGRAFTYSNFREKHYYGILEAAGIPDAKKRNLTPHCCRHTFATLMKNVNASSKDKLELMGHTSEEMLRYYQDVSIDDLRRITDQI